MALLFALELLPASASAAGKPLAIHNIFGSNVVIQRDKPITVWGWAEPGAMVTVLFGEVSVEAVAAAESGRWEATFPAQRANAVT